MATLMPSLDDVGFNNAALQAAACAGKRDEATQRANGQLALALSDVAIVRLMEDKRDEAVAMLRQAMDVAPHEQMVFHNYVSALKGAGQLRNKDLTAVKHRLLDLRGKYAWTDAYRSLLYLPTFLNLEFVAGKCNLHCRMCVGVQSASYPRKFTALPAAAFESILLAAPSISGITLSSGNSDPLLHPELDRIVRFAKARNVPIDIYSNGHPMTEAKAKLFVETGAVKMLNISLDAATPETYRKIRGADLSRVLGNVERLQQLKREAGARVPILSLSMVGMADNIHELPAFVAMSAGLGAQRVNVEGLIGWEDGTSENRSAAENPATPALLREAQALADHHKITLFIPEGLRALLDAPKTATVVANPAVAAPTGPAVDLTTCSWIEGIYVDGGGKITPCCMVEGVADMGTVHDGPLYANAKYNRVKDLMLTGKVFPACNGRPCEYVQQQRAKGIPLRYITDEELGDLAPKRSTPAAVALTVNGQPQASAA